ncbi:MAG TPA: hypothetical protein PK027_02475 [Aquimonas sp.]|nr:hypothetical protein [Xanthomonadales bacterium]HRD73895.1 hypothetical protein [Aquimonas sp.]HRF53309.1 hypothetical protein [Aquimonas sp.]
MQIQLTITLSLLLTPPPLGAQSPAWEALGPGPSHGGQVENITNREVVGAVNSVAAHPSNADILFIGAVNGGIWRTLNATAPVPTWARLTDALGSLSIGSIEFDPTDPQSQTLVAGNARTSSLSRDGGALLGLLRTTDNGASWSVLTALANRTIHGVAARGNVLVAATDNGVYRSTNTGNTFDLLSGATSSGLPLGASMDIAGYPGTPTVLYVAITGGSERGIFRSDDRGETWIRVSDTPVEGLMNAGSGTRRTELAAGPAGQVFVAIVGDSGRLTGVLRSVDGHAPWLDLGVPQTAEQNGVLFGAHPGGQGSIHLSVAADPSNPQLVYVGGDRQPYFGEGVSGSGNYFPNSIGARDYSGRLFRGDASLPVGTGWTPLTHSGTSNNSAPHADSRDMAIDAAGNVIETDDGGIYKRTQPGSATGSWVSLNGNLQTTEYHGIAWDAVSHRVIGGAQDTGTTELRSPGSPIFDSVSTGDGGDPVVEDRASSTTSTRYSSYQNLSALRRRSFNSSNTLTSSVYPSLTPLNGSPSLQAQFYTPLAVNHASATRLLIGANNGVYESLDAGDTVTQISTAKINAFNGDPVVYGVDGNAGYLLFGAASNLFKRADDSASVAQIATLPASVVDLSVDSTNADTVFVITQTSVHHSIDGGTNFAAVTGDLISTFAPGRLRSMEFVPGSDPMLIVAANRGVYFSLASNGYSQWSVLGSGLPNAIVYELEYDQTDELLLAGTLGRGAWTLDVSFGPDIFKDGFE